MLRSYLIRYQILPLRQNAVPVIFSVVTLRTEDGGGERDRTDDLLRARQALSQLSYTPISVIRT